MATYYINPSHTNNGDGDGTADQTGAGGAYNTWASVSFAAGNSYLQARGTTYTAGQITIGTTGSSGNEVILGVYGSGTDKAYLAPATGHGILANAKEYIEISDFDITATQANKAGIIFYCNDTRSARGVRITDCIAHDCGGIGIGIAELPNIASYQAMTDSIIDGCTSYNNGSHGVSQSGALTNGAIIRNCTAYNNGVVANAWGIYMRSRGLAYNGTAWVAGATGYEMDIVANTAIQTNEVVTDVAATGRTNGGATNPVFLTQGTFDALSSNEWAQSGDLLQIDIGENPDSKSIAIGTSDTTGEIIEDCEAYGQTDTVSDGYGIGFDHIVTGGTIRRCYSHDNDTGGFIMSVSKSCRIESCISNNNGLYGFNIASTDQSSNENSVIHSYAEGNGDGLYCIRAPMAAFYNNIVVNNTTNFTIGAESTGVAYSHNNYFGNTTTQNTDVTDLTSDPLLDANYKPTISSPAFAAGTIIFGARDYGGRPFKYPPTIGAYEMTSNFPAQARTAATTRSAASTRTAATTRTARA